MTEETWPQSPLHPARSTKHGTLNTFPAYLTENAAVQRTLYLPTYQDNCSEGYTPSKPRREYDTTMRLQGRFLQN